MRYKVRTRIILLAAMIMCGGALAAQGPVPGIVDRGRPPDVAACATCHLPNGAGRPNSAALAGETAGYFKQQIDNFRNGDRNGSNDNAQKTMIGIAKALTPAEVDAAAAYYSKLPPLPVVKVVESPMAGDRIEEMPDPAGGTYTAYVPPGSLAKGKELANDEAGTKTVACKECHGDDLKGDGDLVPWIAGRSPTYILRQLTNIRNKTRTGSSVPMQMVVEKLTPDDMVAIAAYVGSLKP
ncbi:MAG TPA: c-type cytochrome [Micropepsaceae bacterium]|nr:c-type cytochrome [Micropepsaceae bacterium]